MLTILVFEIKEGKNAQKSQKNTNHNYYKDMHGNSIAQEHHLFA
jgi:hypothetical protein